MANPQVPLHSSCGGFFPCVQEVWGPVMLLMGLWPCLVQRQPCLILGLVRVGVDPGLLPGSRHPD